MEEEEGFEEEEELRNDVLEEEEEVVLEEIVDSGLSREQREDHLQSYSDSVMVSNRANF